MAPVAGQELRLAGIAKRFDQVEVLNDLSLDVRAGEFLTLLGPSGCGKTTLLNLIAGFFPPDRGTIEIEGIDVTEAPAHRRNTAMMFQSYALFPHLTVADNVAFGLRMRTRLDRAERDKRVTEALDLVQMGGMQSRYPQQLSGGQQQRIALARAIVVKPAVLLLDEPLSNLDANLREEMRFEVRRLHDAYRYTTVYVTHDQSEAMTTADLIAVMNGGKIEQAGSPEEIYDRPRSEFVARFIGSSNVVKGKNLDRSRISFAGAALRCEGATLAAGGETAISIRQHDIRLLAAAPQTAENVVPAVVVRQVFLGGTRDYMVEAADGTQLRVVAPAEQNIETGAGVWLHLPPERCRALMG